MPPTVGENTYAVRAAVIGWEAMGIAEVRATGALG